jgi:isopentenyl-diphosphate delta-isomerase
MEEVILVDARDTPVGTAEKMHAHREGLLHRAFSVFVFSADGRMLLQRRAASKYHSGSLWTNSCCSHPRPGEALEDAAHRRLREEMGFDCPLRHAFSFQYHAELDAGLREHELDHVFLGEWDGHPEPDPGEVEAWRYVEMAELRRELRDHPSRFTVWFRIAMRRIASETFPVAATASPLTLVEA